MAEFILLTHETRNEVKGMRLKVRRKGRLGGTWDEIMPSEMHLRGGSEDVRENRGETEVEWW